MSWLSKLFGGRRTPASPTRSDISPASPPPQVTPAPAPARTEPAPPEDDLGPTEATVKTDACRERYWRSIGMLESDVLAYLISPSLIGGAAWPSLRPAYQVVRTSNSILLATAGLSNPFDDSDEVENGYEMELFLETRDIAPEYAGEPGNVDPLRKSWVLAVVEHVAETVADAGGIAPLLAQYGPLSIELPGFAKSPSVVGQVPASFITEAGDMGALLGVPTPGRPSMIEDAPLSPIRLVSIVLLTAPELELVRTGGAKARSKIVAALSERPDGHFSDLQRPSVV